MRVFLTGGTGLVGSHVAEQLRAADVEVRALVRRAARADHLRQLRCELIEGDICDDTEIHAPALDACDALVHAAALVGARASRERYHEQNVAGTRNVIGAAARAGVARAVHVSSVAVYGPIDGRIDEERWREMDVDARAFYAWSKREAEIEAWRHDDVNGLRVTTVRPALIFGERDRHVAPRLDRIMRLPLLPLPDGGRHVLPLVYAGNVARGIVAALRTPLAAGRAYNLAHDNDTPLRDVIASWRRARATGNARIVPVPGGVIEATAAALDGLAAALPFLDLPGMRRPARLVRHDNPYDSRRARAELGWTSLVSMEQAVERTVQWLRNRPDT
ncbi:MAG TPA: NAD(P)-dependent oxidoreductase [Longimicrobiales bacterium]